LFDDVARKKLQRAHGSEPEVHAQVEQEGESDPNSGPDECLSNAHLVRFAVEHAEIQHQQGQHEDGEADPECWRADAFEAHGQLLTWYPVRDDLESSGGTRCCLRLAITRLIASARRATRRPSGSSSHLCTRELASTDVTER